MLNRLITTLRKCGAHGRTFPVQASEAAQAAELIAGLVAQRDELLEALKATNHELHYCSLQLVGSGWTEGSTVRGALDKARTAIAKATGEQT